MNTKEQILISKINHRHLTSFKGIDSIETTPQLAMDAMGAYAKQCLLEAVERIEDQRSKNTIRQLLKELE